MKKYTCLIDESGCSGFRFKKGASKRFVIASVMLDSKHEEHIIKEIEKLSFGISPEFKEFHYSKNGNRTRRKFLEYISKLDITCYIFICKKDLLKKTQAFKVKQSFYKCLFGYAINNFSRFIPESNIIIDKCSGDTFEKAVQYNLTNKFPSLNISHDCSRRCKLLQIADYFASCINDYCKNPNNTTKKEFYSLLKDKIEHIQVWPNN